MIDLEKAHELRIKRANTDWWINEKAVVADNGLTYIAYFTDVGEIHIKELDAKCSKRASRDFRLCKLKYSYSDEHNAPSVCVMQGGKIMVAYTGHNVSALKYRITKNPYDIYSFSEEKSLPYEGAVTYVQLFENISRKELWLFTRVNKVNWQFRFSKDEGETWSEPKTFIHSDKGGLFYVNIRKQDILIGEEAEEQWFFALYGHPRCSGDHTIRSGIFDSNGQFLKTNRTPTDYNLFDEKPCFIDPKCLDVVYASPEGTTVRLLDVSATMPLRVGFAPFVLDLPDAPSPESPVYYSAVFKDDKWNISDPICSAGSFLAKYTEDGAQTYLGGMAYYYGVGEVGHYPNHVEVGESRVTVTNRIFVARYDGKDWVLESYVSIDHGKTYPLEQVIRKIPGKSNIKIWRPIVPVYAQDNMQVYWHEGVYTTHTGGWHCDEVMLVEYDD